MEFSRFRCLIFLLCVLLNGWATDATRCPPETFGERCEYRCHCWGRGHCDENNGRCLQNRACERGWMGEACQYANVAYNTEAWQTNTFQEYNANLAVDGITNNSRGDGSCTNTQWNTRDDKVWGVNLMHAYWIRHIKVYNRGDNNDPTRLGFFELYIGNTSSVDKSILCYKEKRQNPGLVINIDCGGAIKGQYVIIYLRKAPLQFFVELSLCEVEVYNGQNIAYGKPAFGDIPVENLLKRDLVVDGVVGGSEKECYSHKTNGRLQWDIYFQKSHKLLWMKINSVHIAKLEHVNVIVFDTGRNKSFPSVVYEDVSSQGGTVSVFTFGHPLAGDALRIITGGGSLCEVEIFADCIDSEFGVGCAYTCHCNDTAEACNKLNGVCQSGCSAGYIGRDCQQQCESGTYGTNCKNNCSLGCLNNTCNHITGKCHNCSRGYLSEFCDVECPHGTFGYNCSELCPSTCVNGSCNNQNGNCLYGCIPGYTSDNCSQRCIDGLWGRNCKNVCHCWDDAVCLFDSGKCPNQCKHGWVGEACEKACPPGNYGPVCAHQCSSKCFNNTICNHIDGSCTNGCERGWYGSRCFDECGHCFENDTCGHDGKCAGSCESGWWGEDCKKPCGDCAEGVACDSSSGTCPGACASGWRGDKCSVKCTSGYYGVFCAKKCSEHCSVGSICNHIDGKCPGGCKDGWSGPKCETEKVVENPYKFNKLSIVLIAVLGSFILITLVILICLLVKRAQGTANLTSDITYDRDSSEEELTDRTYRRLENHNQANRNDAFTNI